MSSPIAVAVVFGYLVVTLALGIAAGRRERGSAADFVAGEGSFGPLVMYFVLGATLFSAYALLGTPQRLVAKGSDVFYVLAFGSVGMVPLFFFGARVRRIGAREGFVTQAEIIAGRFMSPRVSVMMGLASLVAFVPYLVIQLKGAGVVMHAVTGWPASVGAGVVYLFVLTYVLLGGVRGVGWTNVVQGVAMLIVIWVLGLWIPHVLYGGIEPMFDRVVAEHPEFLTLPGPGDQTSDARYSSEVLMSILGFSMWPHVFMKCFTARSARLVQQSIVFYPTFLFFLLPLIFLGYTAVLEGGPADDSVLLWIVDLMQGQPLHTGMFAFVAFAILAASMSTGDALLHAGGSILVRDVVIPLERRPLGRALILTARRLRVLPPTTSADPGRLSGDDRGQTRAIRLLIVALAIVAGLVLEASGGTSIVDMLLLAYAMPIQFMPLVVLGLTWRRANRVGAELGLAGGLVTVLALFLLQRWAPGLAATLNPLNLELGLLGMIVNLALLVGGSLLGPRLTDAHLARFEL